MRWADRNTDTKGGKHSRLFEAFEHNINQRVNMSKGKTGKKAMGAKKMRQHGQQTDRHKTRIMTLNVSSIANKLKTVEHYIKTSRVHIAVITETHIQEEDKTDIRIKGYTIVSKCQRKKEN